MNQGTVVQNLQSHDIPSHCLHFFTFSFCDHQLFITCRRYLNKSQEDHDEDLPGLEDDTALEFDFTVLRRTLAAAAERRLQNQQDPMP